LGCIVMLMRKHRGLFLKQPRLLVLEEVPTPTPTREAVLIKVLSAGICHSDIHRWKGEMPCPEGFEAGAGTHEVVGKVEERGEMVPEYIKEGQKVLVYFLRNYREEDKYTRRGLAHHAKTPIFIGGMQEYVLVPTYHCLISIENLRDIHAAPPLACAALTSYGAVKKLKSYVEPDDYVAIIGLGGLGSYAVQWLRILFPYVNLIGIDVKDEALNFAAKFAKIDVLINAAKEDPAKIINEVTRNDGVKAFIDFVGSTGTINTYIKMLSHLGIYVVVGTMGKEVILPVLHTLIAKEFCLQGSFMGSIQDQYEIVEFARRGLLNYSDVVTRRLKFDPVEVNRAYQDLDEGRVLGRQVVIFE